MVVLVLVFPKGSRAVTLWWVNMKSSAFGETTAAELWVVPVFIGTITENRSTQKLPP